MTLTAQVMLKPTKEQESLLNTTMSEYISLVNDILDYAIAIDKMPKLSSASVHAPLPSCVRAQCCRDAKSIWQKTKKSDGRFPTLKKPVAFWNNQNFKITDHGSVKVPLWIKGKSVYTEISAVIPDETYGILVSHKLGALRITKKGDKFVAQFAYTEEERVPKDNDVVMGVDLGIKCPAVAVTSTGKTIFYGNGRQRKYIRRRYHARRKKLGKKKKLSAIKKMRNKESRWMRDQDHKLSRAIVNDAVKLGVGTIKLEELSGIRANIRHQQDNAISKARKSRKNNRYLSNWSFYRLSQFIEYKAALAGITVVYVDPAYTSQVCPHCGKRNHANDRNYRCKCGYHTHRDRVGAVNILAA